MLTDVSPFWTAIILAAISAVASPFVVRWINSRSVRVDDTKKISEASENAVATAVRLLDEYRKEKEADKRDKEELLARVNALEVALDMKNRYIEALEREIEIMKSYLKKLIKHLKENDVNFPEPPEGLLETKPKIQKPKM